ncbi:MAG: nucleoside-diphosphate kinase [Candidatus Mycalebacterium zealandia]|nr:MAG: nucleoside-diphosphate kinase [Candidatus Mycalebacterium zealandia]
MEQTLSIVKPDGTSNNLVGKVVGIFEENGISVAALRMVRMTKKQAEGFYAEHSERPFFASLTDFMSSGPCVVMVLKGDGAIAKVRKIMGATDPAQADEGTIRKMYAESVERNVVHGSDSPESAKREIVYFFNSLEISG